MIRKNNNIRNNKSCEQRISLLKAGIGLLNLFFSKELFYIYRYLRKSKYKLFILILLSIITGIVTSFATALTALIIQSITLSYTALSKYFIINFFDHNINLSKVYFLNSKGNIIILLFILMIIISLLGVFLNVTKALLSQRLQFKMLRNVRKDVIDKILKLDIDYFNEAKSGDLLFMINAETSRFSNLITLFSQFISASIQGIIYLFILYKFSFSLASTVVVLSVIYFILYLPIDKKLKIISWKSNLSASNLLNVFQEMIYGIKLIKIAALEEKEKELFLLNHRDFERKSIKLGIYQSIITSSQNLLVIIVFLGIGIYLFISNEFQTIISTSSSNLWIISFLYVFLKFVSSANILQGVRSSLIGAYGPLKRVFDLINDLETNVYDTTPSKENNSFCRTLVFENFLLEKVGFKYKSAMDSTLENINLNFTIGKTYALVGYSGSGKSTLLDILSGLRKKDSGRITINDISIENINMQQYRKSIGYMNQEPIIFHDTVKNNLLYFKEDANLDEIANALENAAIKDFVEQLPDKMETELGERGQTISGGERQRIGLARVFLQNNPVLLLDEATNALDYRTEKEVYDNLKKMKTNKIIIVAAHRLSAIKDFDHIIVFNKGKIDSKGTFEELMEEKGLFYSLYKTQEVSED